MKTVFNAMVFTGLLLGLPLLGAGLAGHNIRQYTGFPPLTDYASPAPFSWPVFIILTAIILLTVVPFLIKVAVSQPQSGRYTRDSHKFPWWGWGGLLACGISWILAWTRFEWFASLQSFTFTPLWLSLIVIVNAVTYKRIGECSLTKRPWFVAALFPASAVFWWFFEFLNRFVRNWVYQNVEGLSPIQYFLYATLPFATVLPAVFGVYEMLETFPRVSAGLEKWIVPRIPSPRLAAWVSLIVASAGLVGISIWPDYLFPLLWVSPLLIIVCIQVLNGRETILAPLAHGNWKAVYTWALAALICGFFWEMWNSNSYSRWIYTVPFVNRFLVFEMPVLGYSGYLPFGLQCAVVTLAVERWYSRRRVRRCAGPDSIGRIALAILLAAVLWLSCLHLFFKPRVEWFRTPTGMPPRAAALAARHMELWSDPDLRQGEIEKMRYSNAEWDFMARTYFVLALANMALREPDAAGDYLPIMDTIIDETIRLEEEYGMYHFLMDYARHDRFLNFGERSVFLDGEIALMLGARRIVRDREDYREKLSARLALIEQQMRETPLLWAESYPNECWLFCNALAIAAFRMAEALDNADHSDLINEWISSVKANLVDPDTGMLVSSFTLNGMPIDGPEGSSIFMVAHSLQLIDPAFAADQYQRARRELGRVLLGFGWAREWPDAWPGQADIDSGPIIPLLDISAGASGMAVLGAAVFDDIPFLTALLTSLNYGGFPIRENGRLRYAASNQVGDAVLLYAMVAGPLWDDINNRAPVSVATGTAKKEISQ